MLIIASCRARAWPRGRQPWPPSDVECDSIILSGRKISYPEIGYPEFCQLIELEHVDPNKVLGTSMCVLRSLSSTIILSRSQYGKL